MLTCEQVDVLLTAAQHDLRPWLRVFTVLAAATGTRTGELCGLEWDDLDLDAGTVRFRQALSSIDQQLVTGEPRSDGRRGAAAAARSMARPGTMTEVAPAAPARLGPPLGRGRRHLLPAIPAPGGLPAGSRAPVAPRRSRPHPTAVGPRAARPGRRPPRGPPRPPGRRRRLRRQAPTGAVRPRHRDRAAALRRRPVRPSPAPHRPPRPSSGQRRPPSRSRSSSPP